jgi:hypothetical protein
MKTAILTFILFLSVAPLTPDRAARQAAAPVRNDIMKLGAFIGEWSTKGDMKSTPYTKAASNTSHLTCSWALNHGFMICDQVVQTADGPTNDLSVYTYNDKDDSFAFFGISRNAPRARTPKLTIEGDLWTYTNEFDDGAKHIHIRTTNRFTSANSVAWRTEYSEDGTHWITMGEGTDTRINVPLI